MGFHQSPEKNSVAHVDYHYTSAATNVYSALIYLTYLKDGGGATVFIDKLEENFVWTELGINALVSNARLKKYRHLGQDTRVVGDPVDDDMRKLFSQDGILRWVEQHEMIKKPVSQGLYVFPSPGRLALFSGGAENVH